MVIGLLYYIKLRTTSMKQCDARDEHHLFQLNGEWLKKLRAELFVEVAMRRSQSDSLNI